MPTQSTVVIIIHPRTGRLLLHKREDFRVWSLPGGRIEVGETWQEAAVRETFEETGYRIGIERLVGEYWRPQMSRGGDLTFVALGRLLADVAEAYGWETVATDWFSLTALPTSLYRFQRIYLADALAELPLPVRRTLFVPFYHAALLRLLFWLRTIRNWLIKRT